jgi:hypothetical protein
MKTVLKAVEPHRNPHDKITKSISAGLYLAAACRWLS